MTRDLSVHHTTLSKTNKKKKNGCKKHISELKKSLKNFLFFFLFFIFIQDSSCRLDQFKLFLPVSTERSISLLSKQMSEAKMCTFS